MVKVGIVGAGRAGSSLLGIFLSNGAVKTVGITDRDRNAPGIEIARREDVFIANDITELYAQAPDIIINVTGDREVGKEILKTAPAGIEVIEGMGAKFLWGLIERQKKARLDMEVLFENGLALTSARNLENVLSATLESALKLTGMPAGSIALCDRKEMVLAVSKGLNASIWDVPRWKPRAKGLTSFILSRKEPVEIEDVAGYPFLDNYGVIRGGIKSILAYPLMINGDVVGILYLDDFGPRQFSDRQKNLIRLFGLQAAQAIDKSRTLDELYRVVADLDETTAYLKGILDDSQDMIATTDMNGKIVEFSRGGERILGYARDEVKGKTASDLYVDREERRKILDILKKTGAVYNHETGLLRKDGSIADISLTISKLRDKTGKVIGTVGVSKDITEEKKLRNELKALNASLEDKVVERTRELEKTNLELARANQIKARFISNMSHELRTPLNSILGFSEILLEKTFGDLNEKQVRHLSNICTSGKHLLQLVNNILDLAKIETGKLEIFYDSFGLREAVDEVVMIMNSLASRKSIRVNVDMDPDINTFYADKIKFKQILYNLISNAIKFTPEGGDVGIRAERLVNVDRLLPWALDGQHFVKFTLWDNGVGIREEDIGRIFEEFEQADPSMSRSFQGTGLGLSLTKRLVDLHGGRISVRSRYGEGSEFIFCLPVVSERKREETGDLRPAAHTYPWLKDEAPLVLVVEDDLPTSEILTIHLSRGGYKVAHAYDGIEAFSKAKELKPFAITLDIMLPRKDGWEVLQDLKTDPETNAIPVLIHSIVDNQDLAYTLGASDYLLKPVDKNVLLGKLGELALYSGNKEGPQRSLLLVSSDPETQDYVCNFALNNGFVFHSASGQEEGTEMALTTKPHAILVDLDSPGLEVIKKLKGNIATASIPVLALTDKDLPADERMNMAGQIERIVKRDALTARDLVMHLKDLEVMHPRRAGLIDELTELFNHRYFQLRLAQEVNRCFRYRLPLTLVLLDVDDFDVYIKLNGSYRGNLALKKMAELLKKNARGSDVVVRYGEDAFCVVLPSTPLPPALAISKRFAALIRDHPFYNEDTQPLGRITVSIGVTSFEEHSPEELIRSAETALAAAVRKGGDNVEVFDDE
jgi:diguanylate cyclase (GGDEF)-like protein/PAS domain S-box-containing protein